LWGGDLLQITRPEQPLPSVREAHIYYHVLFSPIATHDLADKTSALLYPVMACYLHLHAHVYILRLHDRGTYSRRGGSKKSLADGIKSGGRGKAAFIQGADLWRTVR
jgi:hypothetical protein